jgi:serine/threonine protein kinase
MSITGRTFLHYRILEKIGEGGMGAVYKAEDTHLDRIVAVKILPQEKLADQERKQRFVQEAKAASSLNHPNIIVVHDITSDQDLDFMVMEYVEGNTLDHLIGRKGMKLLDALSLAVQIADGLAKAHGAGIVHRDLKPGNIMVTDDGRIKILDFGLAKLVEGTPGTPGGATVTLGQPDKPHTEEGFILGTVAYMSPEQAEGKKVDARSDVFSFGTVLYEMLTGQKAFLQETRVSTLAAILNEDPKPSPQIDEVLPLDIKQALTRCLRKDPQRRWQNMSDLKVVLQDLKEDSESGKLRSPSQTAATSGRRRIHPLIWLGLGAAAVTAAALLWLFLPKPAPQLPIEYEITPLTFDSGQTWSPAISPDGSMVAYSSDRSEDNLDIWVQQIAGGPPLRLTTHPAWDDCPCFSADGSKIVFRSTRDGGGLYEIATLGGQPRRIADRGAFPRYSPDGAWISCFTIAASLEPRWCKMYLISAQGGDPVPFQPDFHIVNLGVNSGPVWSPDGRHLIFNARRDDDPESLDWWVAPVEGGPALRTNAHHNLSMPPIWQSPYSWQGSHIIFATGSTIEGVNLYRVLIDSSNWQVEGPPERITSGPGTQFLTSAQQGGPIVYANLNWVANAWIIDADPNLGRLKGEPVPTAQDVTAKFGPCISLDGTRLAYSSFGGFKTALSDVRVINLETGTQKIIPMRTIIPDHSTRLSPDGSVLAYRDWSDGRPRSFIVRDEETTGREVCDSCRIRDFFPDPNQALIQDRGNHLLKFDISTGEKTLLLEIGDGHIKDPSLAPDGQWVSFVRGRPGGRAVIFVAELDKTPKPESEWILLFDESNYLGSPAWSPNGNRLYYVSERDGYCCLWTQELDPQTKRPVGETEAVYHVHSGHVIMNIPPGNARVDVAEDKLVLWMAEGTSNIYMATPKKK